MDAGVPGDLLKTTPHDLKTSPAMAIGTTQHAWRNFFTILLVDNREKTLATFASPERMSRNPIHHLGCCAWGCQVSFFESVIFQCLAVTRVERDQGSSERSFADA
jgi:hypothetical protein